MAQEVLDLDRDVVGEPRMRAVERAHDAERVPDAVEEVGVAEGDVLRAGRDLLADVVEDDFALHDAKVSVIDRDDGAVPAAVFASAARLRVAGDALRALAIVKACVA